MITILFCYVFSYLPFIIIIVINFELDYVNPQLCPFSVKYFPSPGRAVLRILIEDLTSKSNLLLLYLLSATKLYFEKRPVIFNPIKCKETIHLGIMVILQ